MVTTKSFYQVSIIAGIIFILAGCSSLGRDNVLFLTKTSLGVDVDSKPLTLDVGYDRKEGVIGPVMEKGLIHTNMASFHTEVGIVNQAIGQSFSTGQAAVLMSKYIASSARPKLVEIIPDTEIFDVTNELNVPLEKKRYVFVTDTSFGFRVNFGMETGGIPDALSLGYKRKEMAFVPLVKGTDVGVVKQKALTDFVEKAKVQLDKETAFGVAASELKTAELSLGTAAAAVKTPAAGSDAGTLQTNLSNATKTFKDATGKFEIAETELIKANDETNKALTDYTKKSYGKEALASLLATVKLGTAASNPLGTALTFSQFFATGNAASYLAAHPEIRTVMAPQMIPDTEDAIASVKMQMARANVENISKASDGKKAVMACHDDSTTKAADDIDKFVKGLGYKTYSHFVANQPKEPSEDEIKALMADPSIKGKCGFK